MRDIVVKPCSRWQIYFQEEYCSAPTGRKLTCIHVHGVSRSAPACHVPVGVKLQENVEFTADIQYHCAYPGRAPDHVVFRDSEAEKPRLYIMSGEELKEFFRGLREGKIASGPQGFIVRFTFVKKGTSLFARPLVP